MDRRKTGLLALGGIVAIFLLRSLRGGRSRSTAADRDVEYTPQTEAESLSETAFEEARLAVEHAIAAVDHGSRASDAARAALRESGLVERMPDVGERSGQMLGEESSGPLPRLGD